MVGGAALYYFVVADHLAVPPSIVASRGNAADGAGKTPSAPDDSGTVPGKTTKANRKRPNAGSKKLVPLALDEQPQSWHGWRVAAQRAGRVSWKANWDFSDPSRPRPDPLPITGGRPVTLSMEHRVIPSRAWLRFRLAQAGSDAPAGTLEFRANSELIATYPISSASIGVPITLSLERWLGQTVRLEITHASTRASESVLWETIEFRQRRTGVAWKPLLPLSAKSASGARLKVLPDRSILAAGKDPPSDAYVVITRLPIGDVKAIRLEALRHGSLPGGGPGRHAQGIFALARFSASLTESDEHRDKIRGRYVRVELPGRKALQIAEVQVFSDGRNVAVGKRAAMSTTHGEESAEKSVDGSTSTARGARGSISHSSGGADPWWEVDLGREYTIDRVGVFNGYLPHAYNFAGHRMVVLDMLRNKSWEHFNPLPPLPSIMYAPFVTRRVPVVFSSAVAMTQTTFKDRKDLIASTVTAQSAFAFKTEGVSSNFVFTLAPDANLGGKRVTFRVKHHAFAPKQRIERLNLGCFRLSCTSETPPTRPVPPVIEIPHQKRDGDRPSGRPIKPDDLAQAEVDAGSNPTVVPRPAPRKIAGEPKRRINTLPADYRWQGWEIARDEGAVATPRYYWNDAVLQSPVLEPRFTTSRRPVALVRTLRIAPSSPWLRLPARAIARGCAGRHVGGACRRCARRATQLFGR